MFQNLISNRPTIIKHGLGLVLCMLIARAIYIYIEAKYHVSILNLSTHANLEQSHVDDLTNMGHNLAAIGMTLSLIFVYIKLAKLRFWRKSWFTVFLMIIGLSFFSFKTLFTQAIDYVVEKNYDKAYDAYYLNVFRYGILTGDFTYSGYLTTHPFKPNNATVRDRLLIANTALLMQKDSDLINRIVRIGTQKFSSLYVSKNEAEYNHAYAQLKRFYSELDNSYQQLDHARKSLNTNLTDAQKDRSQAHAHLMKELDKQWANYVDAHQKAQKKLDDNTSKNSLDSFERQLTRFFAHRGTKRATNEYVRTVKGKLGYYIAPEEWCAGRQCPDRATIKNTIHREINKSLKKSIAPLPSNLTRKQFDYHPHTLKQVGERYGTSVPSNFAYKPQQVIKLYDHAVSEQRSSSLSTIKEKLQTAGVGDISIGASWSTFVDNSAVRKKIKTHFPQLNATEVERVVNMLHSRNLAGFRDQVYVPMIARTVKSSLYTRHDFETREDLKVTGKGAIRLLYIPPFALSLSLLAILLNSIGLLLWFIRFFSGLTARLALPIWAFGQAGFALKLRTALHALVFLLLAAALCLALIVMPWALSGENNMIWLSDIAKAGEGFVKFYAGFVEKTLLYEEFLFMMNN